MPNAHCMICKRPLSDFTSIKIGMGPVCRFREMLQPELFPDFHAVFNVIKTTDTFIYIKNTGHMTHKTVTNDVQYVLTRLAGEYDIQYRRIFYIDSAGEIDEILHTNGVFRDFKHGHEGVTL